LQGSTEIQNILKHSLIFHRKSLVKTHRGKFQALYLRNPGGFFLGGFHHYPVSVKIKVAGHVLHIAHHIFFIDNNFHAPRILPAHFIPFNKRKAFMRTKLFFKKGIGGFLIPFLLKEHCLNFFFAVLLIPQNLHIRNTNTDYQQK